MSIERKIEEFLNQEKTRRASFGDIGKGLFASFMIPPAIKKVIFEPLTGIILQDEYPELPPPPTPEEKVKQYQDELETKIKPVFLENLEKIKQLQEKGCFGDFEALRKGYPICRIAQERFNLPWYLPWLNWAIESTCSLDSKAFDPASKYFGAGQRATQIYPNSEVERIAEGFEYLANLPQNHPTDWKELLWIAAKLDNDAKKAQEKNPSKNRLWTLEDAQDSYLGDGGKTEAERRKIIFRELVRIFG